MYGHGKLKDIDDMVNYKKKILIEKNPIGFIDNHSTEESIIVKWKYTTI